eukprot:9503197-Alexandrium_andersonii.AAC.1
MGPCFGVKGAPRCPVATALRVGAAVLRSGAEWIPSVHHVAAARAATAVERRASWQGLHPTFVAHTD